MSIGRPRERAQEARPERETNSEGVMYRTADNNALETVAAAVSMASDDWCFTEAQFDCLATVIDELHREFDARIARAQERILQASVRLALPGELAEREVYELRARVIRAEKKIERELKAALAAADDNDNIIDLPAGFIRKRNNDAA
jgi:hypothetical protein